MIKIAVCGFGTVGQSFVNHISKYQDKIINNLKFKLTDDQISALKNINKDYRETKQLLKHLPFLVLL